MWIFCNNFAVLVTNLWKPFELYLNGQGSAFFFDWHWLTTTISGKDAHLKELFSYQIWTWRTAGTHTQSMTHRSLITLARILCSFNKFAETDGNLLYYSHPSAQKAKSFISTAAASFHTSEDTAADSLTKSQVCNESIIKSLLHCLLFLFSSKQHFHKGWRDKGTGGLTRATMELNHRRDSDSQGCNLMQWQAGKKLLVYPFLLLSILLPGPPFIGI